MARIMSSDGTDIYRMLVTRKWTNGKNWVAAFGPYAWPNTCRTQDLMGPTKQEKQKLEVETFGSLAPRLEWVTIGTTYTNGGEEVNWDA